MKKVYFLLFTTIISVAVHSQVVISQVYGGGGNTGATYNSDFVELFNKGALSVDISNWSIQYASFNGTTWAVNKMASNSSIGPGQYFLVKIGPTSSTVGISLPTPDLSLSISSSNLSGAQGKIALVDNVTALTGANVTTGYLDLLGYGNSSNIPTSAEGTYFTTSGVTTLQSFFRSSAGCTDTNNNSSDFLLATVQPRNSTAAVNNCVLSNSKFNEVAGLSIYPNPVNGGKLNITAASSAAITVAVVDILGKEVKKANVVNGTIDLTGLSTGIYTAKILQDGNISTRKVVIE